jgi:penicillin amidase
MKRGLTVLALLIVISAIGVGGYLYSKQPTRQGQVELRNLQGSVTVRYDERGVPHIRAESETDLYRALGYVHAQDRLFQMEAMRRLARGELAEVLGPKLLDTDKLFRSLRIWTASTNIRTATPRRWSSTCWASPSGRSPPKTASALPVTWPTALPPRFAPSRC